MFIKLFGVAKEITGKKTLLVEKSETIANVSDMKHWLLQNYPDLQQLKSYAIAVDEVYADDTTVINTNSEIALLPPVSGG